MLQTTTRSQPGSPYERNKAKRRRKTSKEERVCEICAQQFKKAEHLARHIRSHTKEKPFNCSVCHKTFSRQDTLLRHSRSHPAQSDDYEVPHTNRESIEGYHERHMAAERFIAQAPPNTTVPLQIDSESMTVPVSSLNSTSVDMQVPTFTSPGDSAYHTQVTPLTPLFSLGSGDAWNGSSQPAPWDYRLGQRWENLLAGDDFDLDAVNMSLLHATSEFLPAIETPPEVASAQPEYSTSNVEEHVKQCARLVQRKWYTFSESVPSSGQITPDRPQEGNNIDEPYRQRLAECLQQRIQPGILPSTPFLDLCIQAYFSKFHPLYPIVHMPTFRPGTQNSILLLSICAAGSLLVGSTRALAHGISMSERMHKAILASWDTYISKPGYSNIMALQASLIGQTFSLLMGRPKDLFGTEAFHGSVIAWARKAKLFHPKHTEFSIVDLEDRALEDAWMAWIETEVNMRIILSIYIQDAELARLHHHEPLLRHSLGRLPQISSSELFAAPTASHWKMQMLDTQAQTLPTSTHPQRQPSPTARPHSHPTQQPITPDYFALCGQLESISALASEDHSPEPTTPESRSKCYALLTTWHKTQRNTRLKNTPWLNLLILWHSIFLALNADLNALECACGRDGYESAQRHIPYARSWMRSLDAKRALLHAMHIQKSFESLPVGAESAIHLPHCLYYCGIAWACFMCFSEEAERDPITISANDSLHFEELQLPGVEGLDLFHEQSGSRLLSKRLATGSLLRVITLLQRIGHWRISLSLADTLLALVEETQDLF